jgi:hypothetical protein
MFLLRKNREPFRVLKYFRMIREVSNRIRNVDIRVNCFFADFGACELLSNGDLRFYDSASKQIYGTAEPFKRYLPDIIAMHRYNRQQNVIECINCTGGYFTQIQLSLPPRYLHGFSSCNNR